MWEIVGTLGALVALVGALIGLFMYGKRQGKTEVQAKTMEKSYENERERAKIDRAVESQPDAESDRLRQKYSRD